MNIVLDLFLTFAKIGLFTFGGGYAMISLIENSCVEKKQWITHDEMMNVTVIAESTPGPIAINCATFVGYKQKGFTGAISATIGMVLPSFCIIFLISMFLDNFLEITWIAHAFMGIKIAVGLQLAYGALEEFGLRDDHFEEDGEIISRETIDQSIDGGEAYRIMQDGQPVGGVVIKVDGERGDLDLLFVSPRVHSKGIGYAAWCAVERLHPEVTVWDTVTPYFEKRNIHFYVNRCGFHIVEFFNSHHPDPNDPMEGSYEADIQ